jgi:glycosyltransferase involved in cell wall biosynthesis
MDPGYARRVQRILRRRELESRVEVLGHVDDVTLAALMRSHHVLAVPSVYEGFGIAYLEAMGFGLVPIGTTAGGAAEIIDHGRNGFLVAPGDVSRLGDLLSDLGRDRARLARLAGAARRRSREFPGWAARMAAVRQWLHTLVTGD